MVFLIHYDRKSGKVVSFTTFGDKDRNAAEAARIELEVRLNELRTLGQEVVVLEARNEQEVRRTHSRYFSGLGELLQAATREFEAAAVK